MPNLPSWLSSSLSLNPNIPNDIQGNKENSLFNTDIIPENAPQVIKNLARNVADILTNIQRIRGNRQSLITTAILTIAQNGYEAEKLGCAFISEQHPHDMHHVYHKAIGDALHKLVSLLESDGQFTGLAEDMTTLMKRIWDDYHSQMPENNGG